MRETENHELDRWFSVYCEAVRKEAGGESLSHEEVRRQALYRTEFRRQISAVVRARYSKERPEGFDFSVPDYVTILSDRRVKGVQPKPGDVVKERLKICSYDGKVRLTQNRYVDGMVFYGVVHAEERMGKETASELLFRISRAMYLYQNNMVPVGKSKKPGPGEWIVYLHDAYGHRLKFQGCRSRDPDFMGSSLSDFIRKKLHRDDLILLS